MKEYPISETKYEVLIKKINNLIAYANDNNTAINNDFLELANFIKTHSYFNINNLQAREIEEYTRSYGTLSEPHSIIASANELIRYSKYKKINLCMMFFEDLKKLKNDDLEEEKIFIKTLIKKYIRNVWREENLKEVKTKYYYLLKRIYKNETQFSTIKRIKKEVELKGIAKKLFNRIKHDINIPQITINVQQQIKQQVKTTPKLSKYNLINIILFEHLHNNTIKAFLYKGTYIVIRKFIIKKVSDGLDDLTKHDKEIDTSTLSEIELQQAINTSVTKFIEIYYQQPKELKTVLIPYENTPLSDYTEVTKTMAKDNKEFQLLNKIFKEYKQDTKGRIYNYSLFAFLYYTYCVYISFKHLYNSELLKLLGAYRFKKDRDKPLLKPNHKSLLQQHKKACILSQHKESIYLENFISFIQQADAKLKDRYVLSYLVDLSHELTASKEYINKLKGTPYNFSKISYQDLPQPIETLLLPIKTLQIA